MNGGCDGSVNTTWNVTVSPGLNPVPINVNIVPTGPWAGRTSMLATGLGSVVLTRDVVVVDFDPPPPPHAAPMNAAPSATTARTGRSRIGSRAPAPAGRQLGERGVASQLGLQAVARLLDPGQLVAGVDRQTDGAGRVGDASLHGLANPPGGVRRELEALAPVELLDGVDQAEVALLDEIQQRQTRRLVLLGDRDDQAQVGVDEGLGRLFAGVGRAQQLLSLSPREL